MYSELADLWSGEIPDARDKPDDCPRRRNLADVDVIHRRNEKLYAVIGSLPNLTGGVGLGVNIPAKAVSDQTVAMVMDCLCA